ncbi:hypothetical protein BB560_002046 [Smittium megazygosporum]|uniref:Mannose-6-phosphate isomerase n=1 Tax=Smittium megazygosporum TaxID=133381 RepID=A0A2T9ZG06_9FUNG|nr:hypothetical protein BB560_002046 [Smittium megazygosporum]
MTQPEILRLSCIPNNYHWGKLGSASKVAKLASADPSFKVDEKLHYSELWMGTHPSGMSSSFEDRSVTLEKFIASNPSKILGEKVAKKYNNQLPFLYKVLSIESALSIQSHPNLETAKELHKKFPDIYKDPNHKPEMALAISDFEAMSGFRSLDEIASFIEDVPELRAVLGNEISDNFIAVAKLPDSPSTKEQKKLALKTAFTALMKTDPEVAAKYLASFLSRTKDSLKTNPENVLHLLHRLNDQYPLDIGLFCVFFLNIIKLAPGEGFFMGADEPHAYISGECIECMATSDNVIRAGLTPKFRDVETLLNTVTYDFGSPQSRIFVPVPWKNSSKDHPSKFTSLYNPPIDEFAVLKTELPPNSSDSLKINGPSILIAVEGSGSIHSSSTSLPLASGFVYFIPANVPFEISSSKNESICTVTAFCDES